MEIIFILGAQGTGKGSLIAEITKPNDLVLDDITKLESIMPAIDRKSPHYDRIIVGSNVITKKQVFDFEPLSTHQVKIFELK